MADDYASTESRTYGYLVKIGYKVSYDYYLIDGEGDAGKASRKTFTEAFPPRAQGRDKGNGKAP